MLHFTDVLISGCNVPLSLWKSVIIALAAAIWDGLKLRAWEQCIIKVGHAEKSRAVPKEGSRLKTGAGRSVTYFKKEFKKKMIRSRLDMARQTVYVCCLPFCGSSEIHDNCHFKLFTWGQKWWTVCRTVYICGSREGGDASVANSGFILSNLRCKSDVKCLNEGQSRPILCPLCQPWSKLLLQPKNHVNATVMY